MKYAADYREQAWIMKQGKWGILALITFIYAVIMGICSALDKIYIGWIISIIISGPFAYGITAVSLDVIRDCKVMIETMFCGFKEFGRSLALFLINTILVLLWTLLFIIPGIIKVISYSMSYYVLIDNPELSANEARIQSMEMMRGNKWRLFCLQISFIGWFFLSILTCGILFFWVLPYQQAATAAFYEDVKN